LKEFFLALQFLTIFPVKIKSKVQEKDITGSLLYFPVVGAIIGLILASGSFIFGFLPHIAMAGLVLGMSAVITGGIHLDGLADTCDGFYGGKTKAETLRIMRDSRIGAMGIIGIVLILLLKFVFLCAIRPENLWKALILMALWGRYSQVLSCVLSGYARDKGTAKFFVERATKKELIPGGIFTLLVTILLAQFAGIIISILLAAMFMLLIKYVKNRIGGVTGDIIGAISEITETGSLFLCIFL